MSKLRRAFILSVGHLDRFVLLFSFLIFLAVRLALNGRPLLNVDEAHFAACAARIIEANDFALIGCRDNKPPGIFWLYEVAFRLFGTYNMLAVRWIGTIGIVVAAYFLFLTGAQSKYRFAGIWAAALFLLAMSVDPAVVAAKTEALAVLPMCAGAWILVRSISRASWRGCIAFGLCAGLATLSKQPAGIILVAGSLAILCFGQDLRLRMLLATVAGFGLTCAIVIAVYASLNGVSDLLFQLVELPSKYASIDRISPIRRLFRVITYSEEYARLTPLLSALGVAGIVYCAYDFQSLRGCTRQHEVALYVGCLFALGGLLAAFAGADLYLNYYIMALPGFAVCAGIFAGILREHLHRQEVPSALLHSFGVLALCGVVSTGILAMKGPVKSFFDSDRVIATDSLGAAIRSLAGNGPIYVWGYSPDLYFRSGRVPASRYVLTDVLVGFFGEGNRRVDAHARQALAEPGGWDRFFSDIERTPPRVFVDASRNDLFGSGSFAIENFSRLEKWVHEHYVFHSEFVEGSKNNIYRLYLRR